MLFHCKLPVSKLVPLNAEFGAPETVKTSSITWFLMNNVIKIKMALIKIVNF
jgi:hypothetical protein